MSRSTRGTARTESPEEDAAPVGSGVPIPQFLQPAPPPPRRQDSADPDRTTLHPQEDPTETRGGHPQVDDADAAADDPAPLAVSSTPASTEPPARLRPLVTAQQLAAARAVVVAGLLGATTLVNRRTRQGPEDDRWLMTDQDLDAVGGPFARILARRTPIPGGDGENASDIADLVEGAVGLIGYAIRQLLTERPAAADLYVPRDQADEQPPAPAGPGATLNPLDPAYRVG